MGIFERYLSVWVGLAIIAGVTGGHYFPAIFSTIAALEVAHVNLIIAVLIWLMIYPMMVQIDLNSLKGAGREPKGLILTLVINWLVKPFSMALLGWLFFNVLFASWVDAQTASEYIAGMILLGVAPCTAMVFVWSQLTRGDANYTLLQVSLNDLILIFAFAPLAGLLLGATNITVPWDTLLLSVFMYVLIPLVAGVLSRGLIQKSGDPERMTRFLSVMKPWSVIGLICTVAILFGFQSQTLLKEPQAIVLIAIPLLVQTYGIFALAYWLAKRMRLPHRIAAPACMIGTSNFFELAVAVAISLFGLHSGAALATVVGVLVEVPVMLSLVWYANRTRHQFL